MRDTIEIIYIEPDSLTLGPDLEICPQELPLQLSGPDYMDSYIWNTGGVGQNINITSEGEYTLQSTYACGEFEDTVVISFIPAEAIDLGNDTVLCNQPMFSRILEAPPGYDSYVWNNGSNGENIVVSTPGTYWLEATYACGTVSDTINIANQPLLSLHLGEDTTFCPGASITLSGGEGFETYAWSNGKTTSSIQVSNYGEYFVEANYACGTLRDTILIFEHIAPQAELPGDTAIHLGDNILINPLIIGDQITTYTWTPATWLECPDCLNTVASPLASVTYLFEIKDKYGCRGSDELTVLVKNHKRVFVPNAFSPNGDGTNDLFSVYGGPEVKKVISMKIFDRWGGMVYLNEGLPPDGSQGWDGNSNGKKLDQGIYIYLIQVDYINGESETISGDLMLHR
jgi:gliding motility-associated-like protein